MRSYFRFEGLGRVGFFSIGKSLTSQRSLGLLIDLFLDDLVDEFHVLTFVGQVQVLLQFLLL